MKAWVVFAALMVAGPAFAVPPVLPPAAARALAQDFIRATEKNDLPAYASLFAPDARIETGTGTSLDRAQWLTAVSPAFSSTRQTRFLDVFAGYVPTAGKFTTRIVFVVEEKDCRPNVVECFTRHRSDVATVLDGKIVHLETSGDLSHLLTPDGAWTFFD